MFPQCLGETKRYPPNLCAHSVPVCASPYRHHMRVPDALVRRRAVTKWRCSSARAYPSSADLRIRGIESVLISSTTRKSPGGTLCAGPDRPYRRSAFRRCRSHGFRPLSPGFSSQVVDVVGSVPPGNVVALVVVVLEAAPRRLLLALRPRSTLSPRSTSCGRCRAKSLQMVTSSPPIGASDRRLHDEEDAIGANGRASLALSGAL